MTTAEVVESGVARRYPVDLEALEKGGAIEQDEIEHIFGILRESDPERYALKQLAFREWLENELRSVGRPMSVRCEGARLRLLTDTDATDYNWREREGALHKLYRAHRRLMEVDVRQLENGKLHQHERRVEVSGKTLGAIKPYSRLVRIAVKRTVPGLPAPEGA